MTSIATSIAGSHVTYILPQYSSIHLVLQCENINKISCNMASVVVIVYAHGHSLCSNWVQHGSTTISYPQCSLTFMREGYLHRSCAYAKSAVGIDVVSIHKLFTNRVVSTVSTIIVSSHMKHCRIAYGITR